LNQAKKAKDQADTGTDEWTFENGANDYRNLHDRQRNSAKPGNESPVG
jgi:hypothetical protein